MYNIYSEEKKLSERDKKIKEEKDFLSFNEKHKRISNSLFYNYQRRIEKFMIDVSKIYIIIIITLYIIDGWRESTYRNKNTP